jgi:hypothetical protein
LLTRANPSSPQSFDTLRIMAKREGSLETLYRLLEERGTAVFGKEDWKKIEETVVAAKKAHAAETKKTATP